MESADSLQSEHAEDHSIMEEWENNERHSSGVQLITGFISSYEKVSFCDKNAISVS